MVVVISYGVILRDNVLSSAPCVNIHPSALPKYRGPSPIRTALYNGDTRSAVCLIQMTPELDAGDIYMSRDFDIGMYVSFNNDLSYPEWNAAPIACLMVTPWDRLLIETDCPYAAPYERKDERCEADDVKTVVQMIAELRGVSEEFVAQKSMENALRVYEINK